MKTVQLYIPYKEVGLSILERKETPLSLMFETILRLVESGVVDVTEMSTFLGLNINVYKEIIAQMEFEDLINISEYNIKITSYGKTSLESQKKILTHKAQINQVMVDLITGEIQKDEYKLYYKRPLHNCPYLDEMINIDIDYIREKTTSIQRIHLQDKHNAGVELFDQSNLESLYRILDIVYDDIKYSPLICFIYANQADNTLMFTCEDQRYDEAVSAQVNDNLPGTAVLFEASTKNYLYGFPITNDAMRRKLADLETKLIDRTKHTVAPAEIEELYYSDRALLEGEINDLLRSIADNKPQKLMILSCRMKSYLHDNVLMDELISTTSRTELLFAYSALEYKISESVEFIRKNLSAKEKSRISFIEIPSHTPLQHTIIVSLPGYAIIEYYDVLEIGQGRRLLKQIPYISFGKTNVAKAEKCILELISLEQ